MDIEFLANNWHLFVALVVIVALLLVDPIRRRTGGVKSISAVEVPQLINHESAIVLDVCEVNEFKKGLIRALLSKLFDRAMTCVSLPMCIKALAEAERVGPEVFRSVNHILHKHRLAAKAPVMRITGCPNGCARPYAAEIGLVGQLPKKYAVYLGGHPEGHRLAFRVLEKVAEDDLPELFDRLFAFWAEEGEEEELLRDFVTRVERSRLQSVLEGEISGDAIEDDGVEIGL